MTDLLFTVADGVATITLNRPDVLNSFRRSMARELRETLELAGHDHEIRAVVLTGAGRGFCAGQDLAEAAPKDGVMPDLGDIVRDSYNPVILAIRTLEKPVICAVNGVAAGAGANLAFACDIVFASSAATFVQSFAKIGVIPDSGGTFLLPRLVGLHRANVMTMLAEKMTAEQARDWGLVYMVTEPENLLETATGTARQLAAMPTRGLGLTKRGFNRSLGVGLKEQLDVEGSCSARPARQRTIERACTRSSRSESRRSRVDSACSMTPRWSGSWAPARWAQASRRCRLRLATALSSRTQCRALPAARARTSPRRWTGKLKKDD
jgi:2-(1,2-epoxy-1,2-dihydrophenyl)acetyl-CoA isomerase